MNLSALALSSLLFVQSTATIPYLYDKVVGDWKVRGHKSTSEVNASCVMTKPLKDRSNFTFIKDLVDGELYVLYTNSNWNITNPPGKYLSRITFHSQTKSVGKDAEFELLSPTSIRFRRLSMQFLYDFSSYNRMIIVMTGSVPNVEVTLSNSKDAINSLGQCINELTSTKESIRI